MLVFAAGAWEKLRQVPSKDLANLGLAILILVVAIFLIKRAAKMNRIIVIIIGGMTMAVVALTWVYHRSEPKFLSPMVDKIAPFFPSAPPPLASRPDASDPYATKKSGAPAAPSAPAKPAKPATPPPPRSY